MQVTFFVVCIVFGLAVAQPQAGSPPTSTSPCSAISINLGNGNATVFGETLDAARYELANNCNYGDSGTAWYSVTPPKGSSMVVSTCGEYTNFDTHLGLYSGSCDSLTCMVGNDDGDCPHVDGLYSSVWTSFYVVPGYDPVETRYDPSTIQWVADGSTYFVAVSGDEEEGKFTLSFVTLTSNGGCVHAEKIPGPYSEIPIVHNQTLPGDNVGVTNCGHISYDTPAAWFTIYPEPGKLMNVTTCGTQFDTRLAVVAGDCSALTCVFQNDDDSDCDNFASTIRFWPTLAEYYVIVMGYSHSNVGKPFVLSVSQDTQELDQNCISAFPFHISDSFLAPEASTVNAMVIETPLCSNEAGPSVWFKVMNQRHAAQVTFTTCTPVTDFETVLTAYSGSCSSLSCKASTSSDCSGNGSSITVDLEAYEQFYLVVSGVNGQSGNFQIETDSFISENYNSPGAYFSPTTFYG